MVLWTGEHATNQTLWPFTQDWSLCSVHLPDTETWCCLLFVFCFHPSFFPPHPLISRPSSERPPRLRSLSPPAAVRLVKSGDGRGSGQSRKWGSPPGWPRHTVFQVRKTCNLTDKTAVAEIGAVCTTPMTDILFSAHEEKKKWPVIILANACPPLPLFISSSILGFVSRNIVIFVRLHLF